MSDGDAPTRRRPAPADDLLESTMRSLSDSRDPVVQFLAPGLLHSLNNQLMVLRGALHPKAAASIPADVVEEASRRCDECLRVMRGLMAPEDRRITLGAVLEPLVQAAQVAFRESDLRIELELQARPRKLKVDLGPTATRIGSVLHALHQLFAGGQNGTVKVRSAMGAGSEPCLEFAFESEAQSLPFPIDWATAADAARASCPIPLEVRVGGRDGLGRGHPDPDDLIPGSLFLRGLAP